MAKVVGIDLLNAENIVRPVKRRIGRRYSEVHAEFKNVADKVVPGSDDAERFVMRGWEYSPEEIAAQILCRLADDATKHRGEKVTDVVITLPAHLNDAQRRAIKDASKIAGLNVLRIINEPTASSLACGLDNAKNKTIVVFDLGGGTLDVSILDVGDGVFEVRSTYRDIHLGGGDFYKRQSLQRLTEMRDRLKSLRAELARFRSLLTFERP